MLDKEIEIFASKVRLQQNLPGGAGHPFLDFMGFLGDCDFYLGLPEKVHRTISHLALSVASKQISVPFSLE